VPISQQPVGPLIHELAKSCPLEWTIRDDAGMLVAVTQNPSFADGVLAGQRDR
jgi:hypothetical protein